MSFRRSFSCKIRRVPPLPPSLPPKPKGVFTEGGGGGGEEAAQMLRGVAPAAACSWPPANEMPTGDNDQWDEAIRFPPRLGEPNDPPSCRHPPPPPAASTVRAHSTELYCTYKAVQTWFEISFSLLRADDASSVTTSVSSVAQSMQFLTVSFSLFLSSWWRFVCYHVCFICCSVYAVPHCFFLSLPFEQMTLCLLSRLLHLLLYICSSSRFLSFSSFRADDGSSTRLFHLVLYLCSSSLFLSLSSFRADATSSVITSVSSVALSVKFLTVSLSLFLSSRWRFVCYITSFHLKSSLWSSSLFLSLNVSLCYSLCQLQYLIILLLPVLCIYFLFRPTLFLFLHCLWFCVMLYLVALFYLSSLSEGYSKQCDAVAWWGKDGRPTLFNACDLKYCHCLLLRE
jgi:hypothetical protein